MYTWKQKSQQCITWCLWIVA